MDKDTVSNCISKFYGKSNVACYISIYIKETSKENEENNFKKMYLNNFLYFKEKLELKDNIFHFKDNIILNFGKDIDNNENYEIKFNILKYENMRFNIAIEKNYVYVKVLDNIQDDEASYTLLIEDNFMENPLIFLNSREDELEDLSFGVNDLKIYQVEM